ncbi:MAG: hypothetical protein LBF68_01960 [Christensenellaceae bacterium]|jgi:hypothetical protein|nr:hypothetical protein [Christensenellaceae bacterium]
MSDSFSNASRPKFQVRSARFIGIIVCVVLILASAIVAAVLISRAAPVDDTPARKIVAILPENDARIGLNANPGAVNVKIVYDDGSSELKTLSDLSVTGLDTTKATTLENVVLNFGGFVQIVTYTVMPIEKVIKYLALEGGSIEGDTDQHITAGGNATSVKANPDEGYRFVEWSDGVKQAQRTDLMVSQDKELTASFARIKYLVIFYYPNGTAGREKYIEHGEPVIDIPSEATDKEMQLYGYKFIGWNVADSEIKRVTRALHIYPQYEKYAADFTLDVSTSENGLALGTTPDLKEYYTLQEAASVTLIPNPDRTFIGWEILISDKTWVSLAVPDESGEKRAAYAIETSNNLITFISSKNGVRDEYLLTFTPTSSTTSIEVRAKLVYNTSQITFNSMGLSVYQPIDIKLGETIGSVFSVQESNATLFTAVVPPEADGYEFKGWYMKDGELKDGVPVLITNGATFERPTELIAYHVKSVYTISFTKGSNTDIAFAERTISLYWQDLLGGAGDNAFPDDIPSLINYTFVGWYRIENGQETDKFVDKLTRVDGNMRLYPKFQVNTQKLVIETEGSGYITMSIDDGNPISVYGNYTLEVNRKYTIRFVAAEGYVLYTLAIAEDENPANETTLNAEEYTVFFGTQGIIVKDYHLSATFTRQLHIATITNGTISNNGTIEYDDILNGNENGEYQHIIKTEQSFQIEMAHGSGRILWITARDGYNIKSIIIAGVAVSNIPKTGQYSAVIQEVKSSISVEILYEAITFVSYIVQSEHGYVSRSNHGSNVHSYGDKPEFRIEASPGYYISKVTIDGVAINPYSTSISYLVSHIVVLGKEYLPSETTVNDERTEKYNLQIIGRSTDFEINVEFAPIYYKITTATEGLGEAKAAASRVGFGESVLINASTLSNFYVASYQINDGIQNYFSDSAQNTSQSIKLENITEDKLVTIIFSGKLYSISFVGSGNLTTVSFIDSQTSKSVEYSLNHTVLVAAGTSAEFTLKSTSGTMIQSVTVDGISEKIGYNVQSHRIVFTNLRDDHVIDVFNELLTFKVMYFVENVVSDTDIMDIQGENDLDTASYRNGYHIAVNAGTDREVRLNTIIVKNAETGEDITSTVQISMTEYGANHKNIFIDGIRCNIEILIPLAMTSLPSTTIYPTVQLDYDEKMGQVTHSGSGYELNPDSGVITANLSSVIEFQVTPFENIVLKYVLVNGVLKSDVKEGATIFTIIGFERDTVIRIVFDNKHFTLTLDQDGPGSFSADITKFTSGSKINLSIIPDAGYELSQFSIRNANTGNVLIGRNETVNAVNNGTYIITLENDDTASDVYIQVRFSPLTYQLVIVAPADNSPDGSYGGLSDNQIVFGESIPTSFGTTYSLNLVAAENCFIERIDLIYNYLTPVSTFTTSIYPDELISPTLDNYRYTGGTLNFTITGDMRVEIIFTPNKYTATVVQTSNGTVEIRSSDSNTIYEKNNQITLYSNELLYIRMTSDNGYHITDLYINGIQIAQELWKLDAIDVNNNRIVEYKYSLDDSANNYAIYAEFQINKYTIEYEIINSSLNYVTNDVNVSQFGTMRIDGLVAELIDEYGKLGIFNDIEHGADVTFRFSPVISKGYHVERFIIYWIDPDDETSSQEKENTFSVEARNGFYTRNNLNANLRIVLEFKRTLVDFSASHAPDQGSSVFVSNGSITVNFTNPFTGLANIELQGGQVEYGTTYNILINPGDGYYLSSFLVNNVEMINSVYSNHYFGEVRQNVIISAIYKIKTYELSFISNAGGYIEVFSTDESIKAIDDSSLVWSNNPNATIENSEYYTNSGYITVYQNYILVTHNTELRIVSTPNVNLGYQVSETTVNGVQKTINTTPGAPFIFVQRIELDNTLEMQIQSRFALKRLTVTLSASDLILATEGFNAMSPSVVDYGGSSSTPASAKLRQGYDIDTIIVIRNNAQEKPITDTQIKEMNSTRNITFTLQNIFDDLIIQISFNRISYDIEFSGDYNKQYDIGHGTTSYANAIAGVLVANSKAHFSSKLNETHPLYTAVVPAEVDTFNDIISGAARYNDSILIFIMPVDGYHVLSISIKVGQDTITDNIDSFEYSTIEGYYTYLISMISDKLTIEVKYEINSYSVKYTTPPNGSLTSEMLTTIKHHSLLEIIYTAAEGYHLASLRVNGYQVNTTYEIKEVAGSVLYIYKTENYYVTDSTLNELRIEATFELNIFGVVIYVNGVDASSTNADKTLIPVLNNTTGKLSYGSLASIAQNRAEGYSITNIVLSNAYSNPSWTSDESSYAIYYKSGNFEFLVKSIAIYLDYHDPQANVLYIAYTTELDTHTASISTHLYETGKNSTEIPKFNDNGIEKDIFALETSYSTEATNQKFSYFTRATYALTLNEDVNYYFAGFQEKKNGLWSYCVDGLDGVQLTQGGYILQYQTTQAREFRAVIYRIYTVTVKVYPDYKYTGGSYSVSSSTTTYRLYTTISAMANFTQENRPNLANNGLTYSLVDEDLDSKNGIGTYKVYSGALLTVQVTDTLGSTGNNETKGYTYYYVTKDIADQPIEQTLTGKLTVNSGGDAVTGDKLIHVYAENNVKLSVGILTEGSTSGLEGGSVSYFTSYGGILSLDNTSSLSVSPNSTVRIDIVPNANFRFDSISYKEALSIPGENDTKRFSDVWITIADTLTQKEGYEHRIFKVEIVYTGDKITKVSVYIHVLENMIFNIKFWKQINVTSSVSVFSNSETLGDQSRDNSFKNSLNSALSVKNGVYDYNENVDVTLDSEQVANTEWFAQYRFIGFYINGINTYERLGQGFPTESEYQKTIKLDSSIPISGGSAGAGYSVAIVAMFIPVLNIYIENAPESTLNEAESGFDFGNITVETYEYSNDRPLYFMSTTSIKSKSLNNDSYTKILRALTRINGLSGSDIKSATGEYNVFNNNYITLSWIDAPMAYSDSALYSDMYLFLEWQVYNATTQQWDSIKYEDPTNANNRVNSNTFTFPVSVLLQYSYLGGDDDSIEKSQVSADIYGNGVLQEVPAIRIRPYYRRKETVTITPVVYYDNKITPNPERSSDVSAYVVGIGQPTAQYTYGEIITLNTGLNTQSTYGFLGWYLEGSDEKITNTMTLAQFTASDDNYAIITGSNLLAVRMNDTRVFAPRYIKEWTITIKTVNVSADIGNNYVQNSTPLISQINDSNATVGTSLRSIQIKMEAGEIAKFVLVDSTSINGNYDKNYDKYLASYLISGLTESIINIFSNELNATASACLIDSNGSMPSSPQGDQNGLFYSSQNGGPYFKIVADSAKTIEIRFKIYGEIEIQNIYAGSTLIIPESLATALSISSGFVDTYVVDNVDERDKNNQISVIKLTNIPIEPNEPYNENLDTEYGTVSGFANSISTPNGTSVEVYFRVLNNTFINLSGNSLNGTTYGKLQTFAFYSGNGKNGASGHNEPFAKAFTNEAGDGSQNKPFLISTKEHMEFVNTIYTSSSDEKAYYSVAGIYFKMINSINLYGALKTGIASEGNGFDGNFDGGGFSLNNWSIADSSRDNVGIFSKLAPGAVLKNIFVGGASIIYGKNNVGYLVGLAEGATITNIGTAASSNTLKYIFARENAGGLIGAAYDTIITGTDLSGPSTESGDFGTIRSFLIDGILNVGGVVGLIASGSSLSAVTMTSPSIALKYEYSNNNSGRAGGGAVGATMTSDYGDTINALFNIKVNTPDFEDSEDAVYVGGIVGLNEGRKLTNLTVAGLINLKSRFSSSGDQDFGGTSVLEQTIIGNNSGVPGFGGGGIIGYNKSYYVNGQLRFRGVVDGAYYAENEATTHKLQGSVMGGIAGINGRGSIIQNTETNDAAFISERSIGVGGIFGVTVGYNAGQITNTSSKNTNRSFNGGCDPYNQPSAIYTYLVLSTNSVFIAADADTSTLSSVGEYKGGPDSTTIYVGGIAGYNSLVGTIDKSYFNGKLMTNRLYSREVVNRTYLGGIVGGVESAYQSITNCTVQSNLTTYAMIWVDTDNSTSSITGAGAFAGFVPDFGVFNANTNVDTYVGTMFFGNGSEYSNWGYTILINTPSGNGSVKNRGSVIVIHNKIATNGANTPGKQPIGTAVTGQNPPNSAINSQSFQTMFSGTYYNYDGHYRNISLTLELNEG